MAVVYDFLLCLQKGQKETSRHIQISQSYLIADHVRFFLFLLMTTRPVRITELKQQLAAAILTVDRIAARDAKELSADDATTLVNTIQRSFLIHELMEKQRTIWTTN